MCLSEASEEIIVKIDNIDGQRNCTTELNDSPHGHHKPPGNPRFGVLAYVDLEVTVFS
jgi:hypothetical protein